MSRASAPVALYSWRANVICVLARCVSMFGLKAGRVWEVVWCVGAICIASAAILWILLPPTRLVFCANLFTPTKNINSIQNRSIIHATDIFGFGSLFFSLVAFCTLVRKEINVPCFSATAAAPCDANGKCVRIYGVDVWKIDRYVPLRLHVVSFDWLIHKFHGYLLLFWFCSRFFLSVLRFVLVKFVAQFGRTYVDVLNTV